MIYNDKQFQTKQELYKFLIENKEEIITAKKSTIKTTDAISCNGVSNIEKSDVEIKADADVIRVSAVMNTTNYMDSHDDVHIDGLWTKTVKENRKLLHLQEHQRELSKVIASGKDVNPKLKEYEWKALGYEFDGNTQALIFDSNVRKSRNSYMFEQYRNGWIENHSVGMQYVKVDLGVNDPEHKEEFEVWSKHINKIANKEHAENKGFFFAVTEAKLIEGSAVVTGSNPLTPTLSVEEKTNEPDLSTQKNINEEPAQATQINYLSEFYKQFKK